MITFHQVQKSYRSGRREVHALRGIDLDVQRGEVFGVIGRSGAGKSSLIRLINGLEQPTSGAVIVDGQTVNQLGAAPLIALRRRIGMIFQHFNLLSSKSVLENVAFPLRLAGQSNAQIQARVGLEQHAARIRRSCPVARSSAWASRARWPPHRRSCCATRPPARWIRRPPPRCWTCWPTSTGS